MHWLKRQQSIILAIEICNRRFVNSKKEAAGRKILLDKISEKYMLNDSDNYELIYDYCETGTYGYIEEIVNILDKFEAEKPENDVDEALVFFNNLKDLAETITPLKNIYANPSEYYGKQIIVYGWINSNDIKRKMIEVGTSSFRYDSDAYPLEIEYSNKNKDSWIDAESDHIITKGTLKKHLQ